MKIAVIGTGYVGLVTGTCFADCGNEVTCIDVDAKKIALLQSGGIPIYEPGLQELVQRNSHAGLLSFTTDLAAGIRPAQLIFIAVGTPQANDGSADLSTMWAVGDELVRHIDGPKIVVIKSTVPVGTNRKMAERLQACRHPVDVASNPEFLKEGAAIEDCLRPDRVVVGVRRPEVGEVLRELYAPFLRTEHPFLVMSPESAEMTKYAANAMLATKISFINEMANVCERLGADINDVRRGIGHDARIGFQFLFPGAGYGGSCFEGSESVFAVGGDGGVSTTTLEALFTQAIPARAMKFAERLALVPFGGLDDEWSLPQDSEVRIPAAPMKVLAFDLHRSAPALADVEALTRREYRGEMVRIVTSMGRSLRVTADHPMILHSSGEFRIIEARDVQPGDEMLALTTLPELASSEQLDLVELLAGTDLERSVLAAPIDDSFRSQYPVYRRSIPEEQLRYPLEIKDNNRMRLRLFRALRDKGMIEVPTDKLQLYTAKGAGTRINASIAIDSDLARLCGYYLAEGFISKDIGRAGAIRERIGFTFHVEEEEYIADVQRILQRWGLKFLVRITGKAHTTVVSSRLLAWLIRDILGCGSRSEDKALPRFALGLPAHLRHEIIRGAFSGDGAVTSLQDGKNLMLEYATVSKRLADGMALLLQSVGVVVSIRKCMMNKSKVPAFILRVAGHAQVARLSQVFGGKHADRITKILDGYQRHIRQHGFARHEDVASLTVRAVERESVDTTVYSLETSTGTVIAASGLVCHNCFPKDIRALIYLSNELGVTPLMMQAVDQVNEGQKQVLGRKIREHYGDQLKSKTLAIWGLAFKPRTDDIREAPSLVLISHLLADGVQLRVYDPEATKNVRAIFGDQIIYCDRPYGALEGVDGLAIVTEWQQFRHPDFELMRRLMADPVIFDGRNLYDPKTVTEAGFTYYSIGRSPAKAQA